MWPSRKSRAQVRSTPRRTTSSIASFIDVQQRRADRLGQARLQHRHLLDRHPVRAHDRRPDRLGDLLADGIVRLRPLHQRADDCCLRGDAAEVVVAARHRRLVVEDRRMAGMGDEIGEVRPLRQVPGKRRRRVEDDHDRARLDLRHHVPPRRRRSRCPAPPAPRPPPPPAPPPAARSPCRSRPSAASARPRSPRRRRRRSADAFRLFASRTPIFPPAPMSAIFMAAPSPILRRPCRAQVTLSTGMMSHSGCR